MKRLARAYCIDLPFADKKPFWALEWHEHDPSGLMRPQFKSASFNSYEEMMVFADLNEIEVRVERPITPIL